MISLVAFVALSRLQNPHFDKLFPHPTGNNALEDYVQAGDMLDAGHFGIYQSWQPPETRPTPEQLRQQAEDDKQALEKMDANTRQLVEAQEPKPTPEENQLTDHLNTLTYLQVKQEEVTQFNAALDMIANGNRKPISFSGSGDPATSFPWLADLRQLSKFASDAAFIAFSEGQPDRAVAILNEGLIMAHRIGGASMIGELSGIGSSSVVMSRFNLHLDSLSLAETREVEKLASQLLDDIDVYRQMERNEGQAMLAQFEETLNEPQTSTSGEPNLYTPEQVAAMKQQIPQALAGRLAAAEAVFEQPEESWLSHSESNLQTGPPEQASPQQIVDSMAGVFASITLGHDELLAILKHRAQLRLLRLHALIHEFRWVSGKYPESLEAMKLPPEETYDPLSRKSLQYERSEGSYRLFSAGVPETGIIELKYRRQGGARNDDSITP